MIWNKQLKNLGNYGVTMKWTKVCVQVYLLIPAAQTMPTLDSDSDVPLPAGPPPGLMGQEEDSDDDIPMPEGPPPGQPQCELYCDDDT